MKKDLKDYMDYISSDHITPQAIVDKLIQNNPDDEHDIKIAYEKAKMFAMGVEIGKKLCEARDLRNTEIVAQGIASVLVKEHRTHQQVIGGVILALVACIAERFKSEDYDLRCEEFYKWCDKATGCHPYSGFPFI